MLSSKFKHKNIFSQGFTMVELLVTIAILAIVTAIGLPSLNEFIIKSRVDSEISEIHRLLLTARNTAINTGKNVTVCPLSGTTCGTNWQGELSVFTNDTSAADDIKAYNSATEQLIKTKSKVATGDTLKFNKTRIVYGPTGNISNGESSLFSYCPEGDTSLARSINVSLSGRVYASQDTDNDGKDEDRAGTEINCS